MYTLFALAKFDDLRAVAMVRRVAGTKAKLYPKNRQKDACLGVSRSPPCTPAPMGTPSGNTANGGRGRGMVVTEVGSAEKKPNRMPEGASGPPLDLRRYAQSQPPPLLPLPPLPLPLALVSDALQPRNRCRQCSLQSLQSL
jgi:hypothetical protein